MDQDTLNELLQWMLLAALSILVLALYRQLGIMVAGARTMQTESFGPKVGRHAGGKLLRVFGEKTPATQWSLIILVLESCPTCDALVSGVDAAGLFNTPSVTVALVAQGSEEFTNTLTADHPRAIIKTAEEILGLRGTLHGRPVTGYPFAFLIDDQGIVVHKSLGADPSPFISHIGPVDVQPHLSASPSLQKA